MDPSETNSNEFEGQKEEAFHQNLNQMEHSNENDQPLDQKNTQESESPIKRQNSSQENEKNTSEQFKRLKIEESENYDETQTTSTEKQKSADTKTTSSDDQPLFDFTNEKEVQRIANQQEYIQPVRKLLNRKLTESYTFLPGSERIILNEFFRRCSEGINYRPEGKNDAFYFSLRSEMSEDVFEMFYSPEMRERLQCSILKNHQIEIRNILKENLIFVEKLLRWKYEISKSEKYKELLNDKEKKFMFETLFKHFILRRKEIHTLLTEINNYIAKIVMRAKDGEIYIKNAIKKLEDV